MTNGSVQQQKQTAEKWMGDQAGARMLQRFLVLVPGVCDELAGCWLTGSRSLTYWGSKVFANWAEQTVVFKFPDASDDPLPDGPLAGRHLENFLDMGDYLRASLREILSAKGIGDGQYDLMCHSMGSLDAFAALVELGPAAHRVPRDPALPSCHTFISVDSPWYGVENMDVRRWFPSVNTQRRQCKALDRGSPLIQMLLANIGALTPRVHRVLAYSADTVLYPEVGAESADIYRDRKWRDTARNLHYNDCLSIEGASHSGQGGITNSSIFMKDVFLRLGEIGAPMAAPAPRPRLGAAQRAMFVPMAAAPPRPVATLMSLAKTRTRQRKTVAKISRASKSTVKGRATSSDTRKVNDQGATKSGARPRKKPADRHSKTKTTKRRRRAKKQT